jgi:hypothetical protein
MLQQQTVQVPRDASQLAALRERRDEMETQLDALSDRRQRLVNERSNAQANGNQAMVGELDAQLRETSARLRRVEADKLAMDDAISAALARGVEGNVVRVEVPVPGEPVFAEVPPPPFDASPIQSRYERFMALEAVFFVVLFAVLWRWSSGRRRRDRVQEGQGNAELRQAVDAIAIEVERISENQRYVTKLLSEQKDKVV